MTMKNSTRALAKYETALDLLNMMVAGVSAEIAAEERKHRPSDAILAKLAKDQVDFRRAADALNPDDDDAIEYTIRIYGAQQRELRERKRENDERVIASRAG